MRSFLNYITEYYDYELLKILVSSIDYINIKKKIIKSISNDKINVIHESIFVTGENTPNVLDGYFVYSIMTNDDKYIYHQKYYIGKFKYSLNKNKLIEYTESTKYKFDTVGLANNYIETELKSIKLESHT